MRAFDTANAWRPDMGPTCGSNKPLACGTARASVLIDRVEMVVPDQVLLLDHRHADTDIGRNRMIARLFERATGFLQKLIGACSIHRVSPRRASEPEDHAGCGQKRSNLILVLHWFKILPVAAQKPTRGKPPITTKLNRFKPVLHILRKFRDYRVYLKE